MTYYEASLGSFASYGAYVKFSYIQPGWMLDHLYKKTAISAIFKILYFSKLSETIDK